MAQVGKVSADEGQPAFRAPWILFWFGLGLRLFFLTVGHLYVLPTYMDHFKFGSEGGHIARALVEGRGFADPFVWGRSGPTAWLAPGYPLFMGGVFKVFGVYSLGSAWVLFAVQCLFNAAMARWIWEIGVRCFNRRVGQIAGWIWALSPWAMLWALMLLWETSISTALFMWALLLTLRLRGIGGEGGYTWGRWTAWGFAWGLLALINPSICLFTPVAGIWTLFGKEWPMARKLQGATLAGTVFVLMLAPWWVRNERVFHKFIPVRGNLGAELCLGNCHGTEGVIGQWDNPNLLIGHGNDYMRQGEIAYNNAGMQEFKQVVKERPREFLEMTLMRIDFYWFGVARTYGGNFGGELTDLLYSFCGLGGIVGAWVAWRRKLPGSDLIGMALVVMPLMYYIVETQERYRQPLEPVLYLLTIYAVTVAERSWRISWFGLRGRAKSDRHGSEGLRDGLAAAV